MPSEIQALNNYTSILEKTNQQLNIWYNPYGLMVGILTLLVALIAMGVAYALWRHSKEQRDKMNKFFAEQEKIIKEKNEQVQKIEEKLNDLIKEYEKQLKSSTRQGKKEIQKIIEELKKEKASIGAYIGPVATVLNTVSGLHPLSYVSRGARFSIFGSAKSMVCTQCGKGFSYYDDKDDILHSYVAIRDKDVYCSFCGAKNIPQ